MNQAQKIRHFACAKRRARRSRLFLRRVKENTTESAKQNDECVLLLFWIDHGLSHQARHGGADGNFRAVAKHGGVGSSAFQHLDQASREGHRRCCETMILLRNDGCALNIGPILVNDGSIEASKEA